MKIHLSSKIHSSLPQKQAAQKAFTRLLGNIAYESAMAARRKIPRDFKLKRRWIVQGIRFERPKGGLVAKVYSLDGLMAKHEQGAWFAHRSLVQSHFLQSKGRFRSESPAGLLSRNNYFINERGIFERLAQKKLRSWYHFAPTRHYSARLKLQETAQQTASQMVHNAARYMRIT